MSKLFDKFPTIMYDMGGLGLTTSSIVTNLFLRYGTTSASKNDAAAIYQYTIREYDTPDTLAAKVYGDSEYHWVILWMNDMIDPLFNWPMNYLSFTNYINSKYGSVATAQSTIHHYTKTITRKDTFFNTSNIVELEIDLTTYNDLAEYSFISNTFPSGRTVETTIVTAAVSCYDWEDKLNENKRNIILLRPEFLLQITGEFNALLQKYKLAPTQLARVVR